MATTTIYTIESTDGESTLVIQPRTWNGQNGVFRDTDLTFYGNATPNWGEMFNENFYRLLENFACEQQSANTPKNETNLGANYKGINNPVEGQTWYNKSDGHLYVQRRPTSNIPSQGPDWERLPTDEDIAALTANDISGLSTLLDGKVSVSGDSMTGPLSFGGNLILGQSSDVNVAPDIFATGQMSLAAESGLNLIINSVNTNNGAFSVRTNAATVSGSTLLFSISKTGVVSVNANNYETLITGNDDALTNKKYVDDLFSGFGGTLNYVSKTGGDTMEGPFTVEDYDSNGSDFSVAIRANTGANLSLYTEHPTFGSSAPPSVVMYNSDNDNLLTGRPSNYYPYMRLTNRDGSFFRLEADRDDQGSGIGANTYTILDISQQNGIMSYYGRSMDPDTSFTNVIRTINASTTDIASHAKNLTTREYVDQEVSALALSGVKDYLANTVGYMWFENGIVYQWGSFATFSNGTPYVYYQTVTLPLSGMTAGFNVLASHNGTGGNRGGYDVYGYFTGGFNQIYLDSHHLYNFGAFWFVVGFKPA